MALDGKWTFKLNTPMGDMEGNLDLAQAGAAVTGTFSMMGNTSEVIEGKVSNDDVSFQSNMQSPMGAVLMTFEAKLDGDKLGGMIKTPMGDSAFSATREG